MSVPSANFLSMGLSDVFANKIRELAAVIAPPERPSDWDEELLRRNKNILRTEFPDDYIEFGRVFGSGAFNAAIPADDSSLYLEVWSPARETCPSIVMHYSRILNYFKAAMEVDDVEFGIFPEQKGYLPFARNLDGGSVGWITAGEPNDWKVVELEGYESGAFQILEMGFSEFLFNVLTRKIALNRYEDLTPWKVEDVTFGQEIYADRF